MVPDFSFSESSSPKRMNNFLGCLTLNYLLRVLVVSNTSLTMSKLARIAVGFFAGADLFLYRNVQICPEETTLIRNGSSFPGERRPELKVDHSPYLLQRLPMGKAVTPPHVMLGWRIQR